MIGDIAVCSKCHAEFEIKNDAVKKDEQVNINIHGNDLQKLIFPKACFRCGSTERLGSVKMLETNLIARASAKPFSMLSIVFLFIAVAFCGVIGELIGTDLIWLWVFVYGLIYASLQLVSQQSCRSVELPYCTNCKNKIKTRSIIETLLGVTFVVSITVIMFLQVRSGSRYGFPGWLAYIFSFCLLFMLFGYGWLHKYHPQIDIRKRGSVTSINIPDSSTRRQVIDINKGILTTLEADS
jgi:hypothetical protein